VKSNKKQPQIKYVSCGLNKYNEIIVFIRYDNGKEITRRPEDWSESLTNDLARY
jgi:hypothetical protein